MPLPQTVCTAPTQSESQELLQQKESTAQIIPTQGSQLATKATPMVHAPWAQPQPSSTLPLQSLSNPSPHISAAGCWF